MADTHRPDVRGLPMVRPPDPAVLEAERQWLRSLEECGWFRRSFSLLGRGGPGYLQSALTLGGGSASASLLAGAAFGYDLLWVAPLGMAIGIVMLNAVAHQTLSTGMRPFEAMRVHAGPIFAWGWALGALLSSVVWHFAQYSLASAVVVELGAEFNATISRATAGIGILVWAVLTAQLYGSRSVWTTLFERVLRLLVWMIVACFGLVVLRAGVEDPGAILKGFLSFRIPEDRGDVGALALVISGLAAAVVVNMVFLYPYTLLARGWGRDHRRLARFDLFVGMFLPYIFATALMAIAAGATIHADFSGTKISPVEAADALSGLIGPTFGKVVFHLGILGMVLTTITMHMVCAGFACSEMFGWTFGSVRYRLALLLPVPGIMGCFLWQEMSVWVAVPTSILSGFMLPLAYLGFIKLQTSRAYLGDDRPRGLRGGLWLGGMVLATAIVVVFLSWYVMTKGPSFLERFTG